MLKKLLFLLFIGFFSGLQAQESNSLYQIKKIRAVNDSIHLESESLNSSFFKVFTKKGGLIDSTFYNIDFQKGILLLNENLFLLSDSVSVHYLKFPQFLTKEYRIYDSSRVVSNEAANGTLYKTETSLNNKQVPFDGLSTSGSITRGLTVGNNQNAVLNSNLDLQITGKLSEKVSVRASLQDSNIPLQDGGYSQKLDQFDNVFMELFSDKWNVRAGDIFLENKQTQFLNFTKKVQGISTNFSFGNTDTQSNVFVSAAVVRGQYAKSNFTGQEGNQGPYKLKGQNGELYVLVVSGSERVYANGNLLKRGEANEYTIDYNAGEIVFTSLFTITSEMRIVVEYQYSDRNYTRFVTYAGGTHENKNWRFGGYLYSENDLKNQPLQQSLSKDEALILANSGDDETLMVAPSAFLDTYSENKILYKKVIINSQEIFEYSNNPQDELYNVKFTFVGNNKGNYILTNSAANGRVYQYINPNITPQGNYEPIIKLVAPTQIQVATFLGQYNQTEKTTIDFEIGASNNDLNLFSPVNDNDNKGLAGKINAKQRLFSRKWNVDAFANYQFVQQDFRTVERLYNIEFDRDWNLNGTILGNQSYLVSGLQFLLNENAIKNNKGLITYQFENLNFSNNFSGNKHLLNGYLKLNKWMVQNQGSILTSDSPQATSKFIRNRTQTKFNFNKNWVGGNVRFEDNQEKIKSSNQLSALSQRFSEYSLFAGRGDSTKVYIELGFLKRDNDSLQFKNGSAVLQKVNSSHTYFVKTKLIQTNTRDLSLYVNYRNLNFVDSSHDRESSLNSRLLYTDRFFNQLLQTSVVYETISGSIPQQEFTYLEVPTGQGVFTWNDYNGNGIQELQEFEVAPYVDQAKYIRIFLPNRTYLKTHQNKFSQSLIINPNQWQNEDGFKKLLSYWYNQTSFLIDRKSRNDGENFEFNPFASSTENVLGLSSSIRNSLYYNRGKQKHSVTYTYLQNQTKNLLSIGSQEAKNRSNQLLYTHLYHKSWLINVSTKTFQTAITSQNFPEKNFDIDGFQLAPKISYLFSKSTNLDLFYELQNKNNQIGNLETLKQNRFGTSFSHASAKKLTMNGEFSYYQNKFSGNEFSSVGFQMLEGLQSGQNITWRLLLQKNLTSYLDVNLNYQGRKSENAAAIHTGNIQLRAYF